METMIPIKEAANLIGKSEGTIRTWFSKGYIKGTKDRILKVSKNDLLNFITNHEQKGVCNPFGAALPREEEAFKPLFTLKQGHIVFSKNMIMVGSSGTIWNITHRHIFGEKAIDTNGHIQICIDNILYYPHRLIAMVWCANSKFKQIVHHINNNPTDNRCGNLIWVTYNEHNRLHDLLDANKTIEYDALIKEIQADNQWQQDILYPFIDSEMSDDNWLDVYFTNYEGWCLLLQGFEIEKLVSKQLIRMEYGCKNEGKKSKKSELTEE